MAVPLVGSSLRWDPAQELLAQVGTPNFGKIQRVSTMYKTISAIAQTQFKVPLWRQVLPLLYRRVQVRGRQKLG